MNEPHFYEYRVEEVRLSGWRAAQLEEWLDSIALDGWRLVVIENPYFIFERTRAVNA